jgi:hypothetical protein
MADAEFHNISVFLSEIGHGEQGADRHGGTMINAASGYA